MLRGIARSMKNSCASCRTGCISRVTGCPARRRCASGSTPSRITVGKAFQALQQEGLVVRRAGSGTYVEKPAQAVGSMQFGLLIPELGMTEIFEPICHGMMRSPIARTHSLTWGSLDGGGDGAGGGGGAALSAVYCAAGGGGVLCSDGVQQDEGPGEPADPEHAAGGGDSGGAAGPVRGAVSGPVRTAIWWGSITIGRGIC